jgi:hypothetical protein
VRRTFRLTAVVALAAVWLIAGPNLGPAAHAELGACYTDPVVVLSNGTTLDVSDSIYDSYLDVQQISYTIHAPAGIQVVSVVSTSGPLGPKETFRFTSSGANGQYQISSTVTTGNSSVPVTASAEAVSPIRTSGASDDGWANQQIWLSLPT